MMPPEGPTATTTDDAATKGHYCDIPSIDHDGLDADFHTGPRGRPWHRSTCARRGDCNRHGAYRGEDPQRPVRVRTADRQDPVQGQEFAPNQEYASGR